MDRRKEQPKTPRRRRAGFTLIEVMIALLILSVGLIGVLSMQIVSVQTNMYNRDVGEATTLADHFAEALRQDATNWGQNLENTTYLKFADAAPDTWLAAHGEPVTSKGVPLSALGANTLGRGRAKFCVAYKLSYMTDAQQLMQGWVRVFWPKSGASVADLNGCGSGSGSLTLNNAQDSPGTIGLATVPFTVRRPIVQ